MDEEPLSTFAPDPTLIQLSFFWQNWKQEKTDRSEFWITAVSLQIETKLIETVTIL